MIAAAQCPQRESLYQYSVGLLSDDQSEEIAVHVDGCIECQTELLTLSDAGDTLVGQLRTPVDEPCLRELRYGDAIADAILAAPRPPAEGATESYWGHRLSCGDRKMLGEYELLAELGRGGMGRVYKARHTKLDRIVAIKILPGGRLEDSRSIARFAREMRAIGQLDHPHVVHAYDGREIDEMPVLVMEYVEGMDLAELVRRLGRLRPADAAELVRQAAEGLQYAHQRGLVHRDIKPSNLMLTRGGIVKLLDLGLARFYAEPAADEVTGTGQMMGTADYVAPEQVSDSRAADIRADIYSLGCTLYKLLSGRAPFAGDEHRTALDKMNAHVHQPAPPVGALVPGLPAGLVALLERMLAKQPEARYATPAEVIDAVRPFCDGADTASLVEQAEQRATATTVTELPPAMELLPPAKSAAVAPAPLPMLTTLAARCHCSRQWLVATAVVLLLLGFGFAAGVMITIYKNGEKTQVEVPDGSHVRVGAEGDVEVRLPEATVASRAPAATDEQSLTGAWQVESAEQNGEAMPSEIAAALKLMFDEERFGIWIGGDGRNGSYQLDPSANPKAIDFFFDADSDSDSPRRGIYRLTEDRLVIAFNETPDRPRPNDFTAPAGAPDQTLLELRRTDQFLPIARPEEVSRKSSLPQPFDGGNRPRTTEHPGPPPELYRDPGDVSASENPTAPLAPRAPDAPRPAEADAPPDAPRAPSR